MYFVCVLFYLLCFTQFLDAYGIKIILFDPINTQQLSHHSLILLVDNFRLHLKPPEAFIVIILMEEDVKSK